MWEQVTLTKGGNTWRQERMMQFMDKKRIIVIKEQGLSNRAVLREIGVDRKTVSK